MTASSSTPSAPLWTPSPERVARARLTRFIVEVGVEHPEVVDYPSLYRFSIERPDAFWAAVWRFCGVVASRPAERVVDDPRRMPGARWFVGARLNFAENLLRHARVEPGREALVSWDERGRRGVLGWGELAAEVTRVAGAFRALGVQPGDRVAGLLPNVPEAVIAMLAATSLGATWSSCSPDFGTRGVLDRFGQIAPRVLIVAGGYRYGGRRFDSLARAGRVASALPSLERVVVVPYPDPFDRAPELGGVETVPWPDLAAPDGDVEPTFEQLPFDHPLYVLYSSGTTGLPKCMVHGAGGTLLQHLKELVLHTDVGPGDRVFYFTTCGWMMWNWLVSSLAAGATVVLYDGAPTKPRPEILWDLAARERLSVFGTSARYLAQVEKDGHRPRRGRDLSPLRTVLSTGSPLAPESFDWVYREVEGDVCLSSISGGTDIVSCFALGNPIAPVHRGELQTRGLGMAVEVWDDDGRPLVGEPGELVCTRAFPSMPVAFWDDPGGAKYRAAYFERFASDSSRNVWHHGDWAELTPRGGMIIHGRSDATLNPGGVRIGTAEIYRQVEPLAEVLESLAIGQDWQGDVRVVLFVRLRAGVELDDDLCRRIRQRIRDGASPRHVPARILQVADLPRTRSGKLSELAVRRVVHGREVRNREALANPEALDLFRDLPELAT